MGRIAPRKRKTTWDYQTLARFCQQILLRPSSSTVAVDRDAKDKDQTLNPPLHKRLSAILQKIWHQPDNYHWMEPLPLLHRRWILIAIALLLVVLLWPYSVPQPQLAPSTPVPLTSADNQAAMQAVIIENSPSISQPSTVAASPAPSSMPWRHYEIASGQTLAQLFRDNNLPVSDVFAMAQVEGRDKPLSNLRSGQEVKLRLNAQGMVATLEIETTANQTIRFTRSADGSFTRSD
ncbi:LysM-like peptidoglycan-binding domain-containing protein [Pectobacterium cacticida]|uniref:LysM-like peptidoglycan-binding domain-containing protein n=1 Tax=Pectobacterium cacticida TaxID=69221 RepID=UPI002FF3A011